MIETKTITLVIPAHNEEVGLPAVLENVPEEVDKVLVVDNRSTDDTSEVARRGGAEVLYEDRKGYGRAYKTGFAAVSTDLIATADADGTYPVELIPELGRQLLSEGLDFISTRRIPSDQARNLENMMRFSGNMVLTVFTMVLFFRRIYDSQSGMWVFRRELLDRLKLTSDGMPFSEEIKIEAWRDPGIDCIEVGVPFSYSSRLGAAKLDLWRDGFRNLLFLFAKRFGIPMTRA